MNKEQTERINEQLPYGQGIFLQPNGIPTTIKTLVLFSQYTSGGVTGGDCWGGDTHRFAGERPKDHMKVLRLVLKEIAPTITYLDAQEIDEITHTAESNDGGDYYGNYDEYHVEYIVLSDLIDLLTKQGYLP